MNTAHLVFYKKIISLLSQPYPFYYQGKNNWVIAGLFFVMTILFNYLIEPFEVYKPEHKMDYFWISVIHACSPVLTIGLLALTKTTLKTEENWNVRREILLILVFLLCVGVMQFLIRDIIYNNPNNWSWRYFYEEIRNTLLIGSLFAILFISLNYNRLNFKYNRNAQSVKSLGKKANAIINSIVTIETQVQSDVFTLNLNNFLFAKADGNYVELYLSEKRVSKIVKRITLKELEAILITYPNIFKTHRSYLVNLYHVQKVVGNAQGYKLKLSNYDEKVPVSRNKVQAFDAVVKKF